MDARDRSCDDSLTTALRDPVEAAAFLDAVIEMDDPTALLLALRQVAQAHRMAEVARRAEVGGKTLFKALSENGNPSIATVHKVLHAVGLKLSVTPAQRRSIRSTRPEHPRHAQRPRFTAVICSRSWPSSREMISLDSARTGHRETGPRQGTADPLQCAMASARHGIGRHALHPGPRHTDGRRGPSRR